MRDIVIPYLRNNSGELEACVSLIKKNVPHRNIYVVEDFERSKYSNISHINQILKLRWAIENLDLSAEFYLFNDDFFVLEPVDEIPYMHRGLLSVHVASRRGHGLYTNAVRYTLEVLGNGATSYETHVPFLFNKNDLMSLMDALCFSIEAGKCPLIRSWYGNIFKVGGIQIEDVKNIPHFEGATYLSTTEQSFRRGIGDYIRSKI